MSLVHTTKPKDRILAAIPDLRSQTEGRDILLIYDEDIGTALKQACNDDCVSDALILAKASNIIRRDVFERTMDVFLLTVRKKLSLSPSLL